MGIEHQFNKTAYLASPDGLDSNDEPTYTTPQEIQVRYEEGAQIFDQNGRVQFLGDTIMTSADVQKGDIIWPPGADPRNEKEARRIEKLSTTNSLASGKRYVQVTLE